MSGFLAEWGWMIALFVGPALLAVIMILVMKAILDPDGSWR